MSASGSTSVWRSSSGPTERLSPAAAHRFAVLVAATTLMAGCRAGGDAGGTAADRSSTSTVTTRPRSAPAGTAERAEQPAAPTRLLAAGDIAGCETQGDELTAALLDAHAGTIVTLGDNVYERGTAEEFARCYAPTWGRHLDRTRPAAGNHDYGNGRAGGYFDYFGEAAGERGRGWYSFDLGGWHLVALNSNCVAVGGCGRGSEQERWLRADLAANPRRCTLAYWHHPRFSSGLHGSNDVTSGLWAALQEAGADVVLAGHDHSYERFAPLDTEGRPARSGGIRQFVVGTGGRSLYPFRSPLAGSEVRQATAYGVLQLTLNDGGFDWRFLAVEGSDFNDSGSDTCR